MFDDQAARATRLLDALIRSSGQTAASLQARSTRLRGLADALEGSEEITLQLLLEALRHLEVPNHLYFGALFPPPASGSGGPRLSDRLQKRTGAAQAAATPELPTPTAADLEERIRAAIEQALGH
ncbi:MAG TPA: hypothetical protein VN851_22375 [Thermoanaerobaculia bacterium]|nr:hypothetical protein [Thermoanaerobaculia bacterium]